LISLDCVRSSVSDEMAARLETAPGRLVHLGLGASDATARAVASLSSVPESSLRSLELGAGSRGWRRGEEPPWVGAVPAPLESLTIDSWNVHEELLLDLLRGDRIADLRDLILQDVAVGNPDLGGRFSPRLRRLELRSCLGFIEGLGHANHPLALARLVLEDVEVRQHELVSLLSYCQLVSLRFENVVGLAPEGLAAVLALAGTHLVQLELGRFSDDSVPDYGNALLASVYPTLAELRLGRSMFSPRAFAHLMDVEVTPALERLDVEDGIPDEQWLELIARETSPLHWIHANTTAAIDSLLALLRDASSGVSGACFHIRPSVD